MERRVCYGCTRALCVPRGCKPMFTTKDEKGVFYCSSCSGVFAELVSMCNRRPGTAVTHVPPRLHLVAAICDSLDASSDESETSGSISPVSTMDTHVYRSPLLIRDPKCNRYVDISAFKYVVTCCRLCDAWHCRLIATSTSAPDDAPRST